MHNNRDLHLFWYAFSFVLALLLAHRIYSTSAMAHAEIHNHTSPNKHFSKTRSFINITLTVSQTDQNTYLLKAESEFLVGIEKLSLIWKLTEGIEVLEGSEIENYKEILNGDKIKTTMRVRVEDSKLLDGVQLLAVGETEDGTPVINAARFSGKRLETSSEERMSTKEFERSIRQ